MKAFRFDQPGGPEVMRWDDVPLPEPGPGEVRIRHTAVALNFRDILVRRGQHAVKSFPSGLGTESAGVIEAVGPGVTEFAAGDRVATVGRPDCAYAEARIAPAARVVKLPDGIDERTAASMMVRGMTARYLLQRHLHGEARRHHRDPRRGRRRRPDRQPMGQASRRHRDRHGRQRRQGRGRPRPRLRSRAALRRFRADRCARSPAARACRWSMTRSARLTFENSLKCLRPRGILASFGESSGDPPPVSARDARQHGLAVRHPSEPDPLHRRRAPNCWRPRTTCSRMVASGKIKIEINHSYPLREARAGAPRRRGAQDHRLGGADPLSRVT